MASQVTIEVTVGADGALIVPPEELGRVGAGPGDRVRVEPVLRHRRHSMLGIGVDATGPPGGFTDEDLRAIRHEMGASLGDELTP